ncbi:ArtI protein, partial [Pseudomonas sp. 5S1]|nr:ArtI protein [Pseudomonas sp. 5S1]
MNTKPHALLLCGLLAQPWGVQAQETPSHLDSDMQQGLLTVCTTGHYKPYTYKNENGEYEGIDIAMA